MPRMTRYQWYLRLIDISFWLSVIYCLRMLGKLAGILPERFPAPIGPVYTLAVGFNFALAIFLVVARFMRDEHAERIWHLAAQRFVYFLVVVPMVLGIAMVISETQIAALVGSDPVRESILGTPPVFTDPAVAFAAAIGTSVIAFGAVAPTIFVLIYKWCLWRDSR